MSYTDDQMNRQHRLFQTFVCFFGAWACSLTSAWAADLKSSPAPHAGIDFNRQIRPILSDNCFSCHGPDDGARKAKLRLDKTETAFKGGKSGEPAIVAGKP